MFGKINKHWNNIKFAIKYMTSLSKEFIFITILSAILTAAYNVYTVYLVKIVISYLSSKEIKEFLLLLLVVFIIGISINIINNIISHYFTPILNNNVAKKVKWDIYNAYLRYSYQELNQTKFYDLYVYVLDNSYSSFFSAITILGKMLSNMFSIIGIAALFTQYDYSILIIIICGVLISFILSLYNEKKRYQFNIDLIPKQRAIDYIGRIFYLPEYSDEIHLNRNKTIFYDYYKEANQKILSVIKKWQKLLFSINLFQGSTLLIINVVVLLKLGIEFFNGMFSMDVFAMFFNGTQQLYSLLFSFLAFFSQFYSISLNIQKFRDFMQVEEHGKVGCYKINKMHSLEMKNISFSYNDLEVLRNISLKIDDNVRSLAIVGENGSGKTTLVKVMLGLLKCKSGTILMNGTNILDIDTNSFESCITMLFQNYKIFSFTIAQNILLKFDITKDDELRVIEALKVVNLYEKVAAFPNGIHTAISTEFDSDGLILSGGELQKIAFARAYASNSDLVVFDEPYNSLDVFSEIAISNIITAIMRKKFVVIISHKVIRLNEVDKIYVIKNGVIIETGSLGKLLQQKGTFYDMFITQKKDVT